MSELGERVFNEVIQLNYPVVDLIKKTIELMEESFSNQFRDRIDERVEEIAMEMAKDINGIPARTLIAKDIVIALIANPRLNTTVSADIAKTSVVMTDELLKALKK